jgi:hypothetical protein
MTTSRKPSARAKRASAPELRRFIVKLTFTTPATDDSPESTGELVLCAQLPASETLDRDALTKTVRRLATQELAREEDIRVCWVMLVPERDGLLWEEHRWTGSNGLPVRLSARRGPGYEPDKSFDEPLL